MIRSVHIPHHVSRMGDVPDVQSCIDYSYADPTDPGYEFIQDANQACPLPEGTGSTASNAVYEGTLTPLPVPNQGTVILPSGVSASGLDGQASTVNQLAQSATGLGLPGPLTSFTLPSLPSWVKWALVAVVGVVVVEGVNRR